MRAALAADRCRDIAHVSAVELRTQVPALTVDFFVRLLCPADRPG